MKKPKDGVCCSCGYKASWETKCKKRKDKTHCVHWGTVLKPTMGVRCDRR